MRGWLRDLAMALTHCEAQPDNGVRDLTVFAKGEHMGNTLVGTEFSTGNATVATLPIGTTLEVTAKSRLTIKSVPKIVFKPGDRIISKYGPGTVLRISDTLGGDHPDRGENQVFYVADGTAVLRVADMAQLKAL